MRLCDRDGARDCLERQLGPSGGAQQLRRPVDLERELARRLQSRAREDAAAGPCSASRSRTRLRAPICCCTARESHPRMGTSQLLPDNQLLYVRGFDQQAQRFIYQVNPRFGNTSPAK